MQSAFTGSGSNAAPFMAALVGEQRADGYTADPNTQSWIGANRSSFEQLSGLAHMVQSIEDILTTRPGERLYREAYGSRLFELIDRPLNDDFEIDAALYVQEALDKLVMGQDVEPRFELRRVTLSQQFPETKPAQVTLNLLGTLSGLGLKTTATLASTSGLQDQTIANPQTSGSMRLSRTQDQFVKSPSDHSGAAANAATYTGTGKAGVGAIVIDEVAKRLSATRLKLNHAPLAGTIKVRVNGVGLSAASLEVAGRSLRLDFALEPDDQVEVDYWAMFEATDLGTIDGQNFISLEGLMIGRQLA